MASEAHLYRLDPDTFVFFGADPAHSPAREHDGLGRRASRTGKPAPPRADCPRCGGARLAPNGRVVANAGAADPVGVAACHVDHRGRTRAAPLLKVCGACGRTPLDGSDRLGRAVKADDDRLNDGFEHLATPDVDSDGRTGRAVSKTPGGPAADRPLTRRERRALQFGRKTPEGG